MKHVFEPEFLAPRDAYKLLTGLVVPRPIGWIGTRSVDGVPNLAPFSFFNAVSGYPPTVLFSPGRSGGVAKDTWANVEATGEFSVNIVNRALGEAMNATAAAVAPEVDEFTLAGLTPLDGDVIGAPLVSEAPANLECRVTNVVPVGRAPTDGAVIFGEVIRLHVVEGLLDGTRIDPAALDAIGRLAGSGYTTTRDRFELIRPA